MGDKEREFSAYRRCLNERILSEDHRVIKRVYLVDEVAYAQDSALSRKIRELLGLVASLVLRCDDCVRYPLGEALATGNPHEETVDALGIGLVGGGTIVVPHLRRAMENLDDLAER